MCLQLAKHDSANVQSLTGVCICLCLLGLVSRPEPNPQQTRKEEAVRGRHADGHQSNWIRPTCPAHQHQQQVNIGSLPKLSFCNPNTWHPTLFVKAYIRKAPWMTYTCGDIPMATETFCYSVWKELSSGDSPLNEKSVGTLLKACQLLCGKLSHRHGDLDER